MTCHSCNSKLVRIPFQEGYYLVCDNYQCRLYRERQACHRPRTLKPGYPAERERRREAYLYARAMGLPAAQAKRLRGCSWERVQRAVKEGKL